MEKIFAKIRKQNIRKGGWSGIVFPEARLFETEPARHLPAKICFLIDISGRSCYDLQYGHENAADI